MPSQLQADAHSTTPATPSESLLDGLFTLAVAVGILTTLLMAAPAVHGHMVLPALDLVMDTIALVVCISLTALAWIRFRENGVIAASYHASAFLVLSVAYMIAVVVSMLHSASMTRLSEPENVQVLVFAIARAAAAILFVLAGVYTGRRTYGTHPRRILVVPVLVVAFAAIVASRVGPPPDVLQIVKFADGSPLPHTTAFGAFVHLSIAVLFFTGAYASRRLWHAHHAVLDGWIAVGLVFAGFGELNWTLYPSAHPGQVSVGDLFRLACSIALLLGLEQAVLAGVQQLRTANLHLAELRDVEVERATLEERAKLARELHDGLAQDLWLAKLRTGELLAMPDLPPSAREVAQSAAAAVDLGLGEAREAVAALRTPTSDESGFGEAVRRIVEEYGDRYGLRVEFALEGHEEARIAPRTQAEILRIAQEALTNVARHAEASVVGVRLTIDPDRVSLRVVDNGRGFDPATVRPGSFGLASMRERAALIGGTIRVVSSADDGTRVILSAPYASSVAAAAGSGA